MIVNKKVSYTLYYSFPLNIELSLSHCEINGFLPPPVSISVTLFSQVIIWNPTWFSMWELERQSKEMRYGGAEKQKKKGNAPKLWVI